MLLELIKENDLNVVINAIEKLAKIKSKIVNTDNIKNIISKSPRVELVVENKDKSIQNASINQIAILNDMFNLKSVGGYEN